MNNEFEVPAPIAAAMSVDNHSHESEHDDYDIPTSVMSIDGCHSGSSSNHNSTGNANQGVGSYEMTQPDPTLSQMMDLETNGDETVALNTAINSNKPWGKLIPKTTNSTTFDLLHHNNHTPDENGRLYVHTIGN